LLCKALVYAQDQNKRGAEEFFDKALAVEKKNAMIYFERGKYWIQAGESKMAVKDLEQASKLGSIEAKDLLSKL